MTSTKPRPIILCIEWEDPESTPGWTSEEDIHKATAPVVVSVGMLVHEDPKSVKLALDWAKHGGCSTWGVIPKTHILKRKELKLPRGIWKERK